MANTCRAKSAVKAHLVYLSCVLPCFLQCALAEGNYGDATGCQLEYIRPVVYVGGFQNAGLYDSSNEYKIEWRDDGDFTEERPGIGDMDLPLEWDPATLTQAKTAIGVEESDNDPFPGIKGRSRDFLSISQSAPQLFNIVETWERSPEAQGKQLLYPVAWDWRRDYWEQAERVLNMVQYAEQQTGCKPVVIGISFGGTLAYTAFTRYREAFAEHVHSVLYAVTPFTTFSSTIALFSFGLAFAPGPITPESLFSYPVIWELVTPLEHSCINAPPPGQTTPRLCQPGELQTGVSCLNAACGRPEEWPEGEPFLIPIDLLEPKAYQQEVIGLRLKRLLAGEAVELSRTEARHIQFVAKATARVHDGLFGESYAAVAAVHPPTITLSMTLGREELEGVAEPVVFQAGTAVGCVGVEGGPEGGPQCAEWTFSERVVASDGRLPSEATFVYDASAFGDKLQELNVTTPPPVWFELADPSIDPHAISLLARTTPEDTVVDCAEYPARVQVAEGGYPSLEGMLCSLILSGTT